MRVAAILASLVVLAAAPAEARSLEEIRQSGALRICVAGSLSAFYQVNAEAFARFLRVQPEVTRLAGFDEQFKNDRGVVDMDASYEPRLFAEGRCDLFPNDLHVVPWRESKMRLVPYYTVRKVVVAHRELRGVLKSVSDLAGRAAAVQKGTAYDV
jgi:two-component system sensor histidine kinase/response regulator